MVPSPTCSTGPPPGHPRFQVQLLGEGGWSCVQDSSAGGTSSPDAWAQLHQPPLLARRGVPSSRGRPGEHVATSRGPRPSAWWAGRPPTSEQPFTVYKACSQTCAVEPRAGRGQRILVDPMLQTGIQRPKDGRWRPQASRTAPGRGQDQAGSAASTPTHAFPRLRPAASGVWSWALLAVSG